MRRAYLIAVVGVVLVMTFAGVALAAVITCTGGLCEGTNRPDTITGSDVRDRIFALGGVDDVFARAGSDEINGGDDSDSLCGENGNDTYFGGGGADALSEFCGEADTPTGADEMHGGSGTDFIEGNIRGDTILGEEGDDTVGSGQNAGFAQLFGDEGNDTIRGGEGEDSMEGEEGEDRLFGGPDSDLLDAADNEETVPEQDFVDCGPGIDKALVNEPDEVRECERITQVVVAPSAAVSQAADDKEQRQLRESFLQTHSD